MPDSNLPNDVPLPGSAGALRMGMRVAGRYELQRELGRGGMGVVWLALDHTLQRQVAFKVLPDVLRQDRTALVDLRDETRRNLEITHPHIVRIYDFEEEAELAGITMEYVDGETLATKKVNRPQRTFDPLELVPWIRQLCEALHYAHTDPRVVHRDLKPANLMVNTRGQLKITDFGIARSINDSYSRVSNAQPSSGTLVYMSPQQLMGSSVPSDDIYSVGATLYDLITSKPPFYSGNISAQVLQSTAPSMAERRSQLGRQGGLIPAVFEEVVAACIAKEGSDRPPSALAIIERIEAGLGTSRQIFAPLTNTSLPYATPPPATAGQNAPIILTPPPYTTATVPATAPVLAPPPSRGPWVLIAVFITMGLLALAGGIYFGTRGDGTTRPGAGKEVTPVPVRPGRVIVNIIPSGARVWLDGREVGKSPVTIEDVAPGDHRLHVEASGFDAFDMQLAVGSGETMNSGIISLIASKRPEPPPVANTPANTRDPGPVTTEPRPRTPPALGLSPDAVRNTIRTYLNATNTGNIEGIVSCYSNSVDFFDEGTLSNAALRKSQLNYRSQWPQLTVTTLSDIEVTNTEDPDIKIAKYEYRFVARNGAKFSAGTAHDVATVKRFGDRALIIRTRQTITDREKNSR
jgi:serine/threonine protein kinase